MVSSPFFFLKAMIVDSFHAQTLNQIGFYRMHQGKLHFHLFSWLLWLVSVIVRIFKGSSHSRTLGSSVALCFDIFWGLTLNRARNPWADFTDIRWPPVSLSPMLFNKCFIHTRPHSLYLDVVGIEVSIGLFCTTSFLFPLLVWSGLFTRCFFFFSLDQWK